MSDLVQRVLQAYPQIAQPLASPAALGNAGGLSGAQFWKFTSGLGELVLRRWPDNGPSETKLRRNHDWLFQARSMDILPLPIRARNGDSLVSFAGAVWEMAPWKSGTPPSTISSTEHVLAVFEALARFHSCFAHAQNLGTSATLVDRLQEVKRWRTSDFEGVRQVLANLPSSDAVRLASQWLDLAEASALGVERLLAKTLLAEVPIQPCLRDVRRAHWLFEGQTLNGLVDFGAMDWDTVAADLGRLIGDWFDGDPDRRQLALDSYQSVRPLDRKELELINVFEVVGDLLVGAHWTRWHFIKRRLFEDPQAVLRGLGKGVERAQRLSRHRLVDGSADRTDWSNRKSL